MSVTIQEKQNEPGVVSSHGYVVDNSVDEYNLPKSAAELKETPAETSEAAAEKTPPAAAAAAENTPAETDAEAAKAGSDVGLDAVLQEIMGLKQAMQNPQQTAPQQGPDPLDEINTAISALEKQVETGEITGDEFAIRSLPLVEQRVQINMERKMQADSEAKGVRDAQGAFIAQNPDFMTFAQSPEAAAMINGNPVLDNVSAYYAAKHMQAQAENQTLSTELAALKAEMAKTIKVAGKEQAPIVGSDTGTDAQVTKTYRGDGLDPQTGGLTALRGARAN